MGNVVDLPVASSQDKDVQRVVARMASSGLQHVVVVGVTEDGDLYFDSTHADGADANWLLDRGKRHLQRVADMLAEGG